MRTLCILTMLVVSACQRWTQAELTAWEVKVLERPFEVTSSVPKAKPVPGKPGFVYSPFDTFKFIDVRGLQPGALARCPFTKHVFSVP